VSLKGSPTVSPTTAATTRRIKEKREWKEKE
jgi:hypothetical protein